jgi:hypothetical protein
MLGKDELRVRWPHELWLPQSHKSSGELVVSDAARVSSEAAASADPVGALVSRRKEKRWTLPRSERIDPSALPKM